MNCIQETHDEAVTVVKHALNGFELPPEVLHDLINGVSGLVEKQTSLVTSEGASYGLVGKVPDWEKRFEELTPDFVEGSCEEVDAWLTSNQTLYREYCWPESMLEFDVKKLKAFIASEITIAYNQGKAKAAHYIAGGVSCVVPKKDCTVADVVKVINERCYELCCQGKLVYTH